MSKRWIPEVVKEPTCFCDFGNRANVGRLLIKDGGMP